jgi:predicted aspartyl protease
MPPKIGFLNSSGRPAIKIWIFGAYWSVRTEFEAVIDTGFSGFLSMPLMRAFPLGLPLIGTTSVVLADGKTHEKFIAMSSSAFEDSSDGANWKPGVVILEPTSSDILIGMEFIREHKQTLLVYTNKQAVALFDDADVDAFMATAIGAAAEPPPPSPAPPHSDVEHIVE